MSVGLAQKMVSKSRGPYNISFMTPSLRRQRLG